MIDWENGAEAIVNRLKVKVAALNTVLHIKDAETESNPATLPAAYVAMGKTDFQDEGNGHYSGKVTWQVLIRCQRMTGVTGALPVSTLASAVLSGFQVGAGMSPLVPVKVEFFREEFRPEPAYLLTFSAQSDQISILSC